jgi:hypothetical protein
MPPVIAMMATVLTVIAVTAPVRTPVGPRINGRGVIVSWRRSIIIRLDRGRIRINGIRVDIAQTYTRPHIQIEIGVHSTGKTRCCRQQ